MTVTKRHHQILLAGIILGALALMSLPVPSLTPWFIAWLLAGTVLSYSYRRRRPKLIGTAVFAMLVLAGAGLYPRWQRAMQTVSVAGSYEPAGRLTEALRTHLATPGGQVPGPKDPFWQSALGPQVNPYTTRPLAATLEVRPLLHRAGLVTAVQGMRGDPNLAGALTVFTAERRFFVVVARGADGAPMPFNDRFSNLKTSQQGAGEVRAVDKGVPGNQGPLPVR